MVLFGYGLFMVFIRSNGSLDGDEAIYSQVTRETLFGHHWLTLFWRNKEWFEKPPLFIWLQMIAVSLGGYKEIALRFFSGFFGVLTAMTVYFFSWNIFKSKRGAFISGLIVLSTPLFVNNMRMAMMDTTVTFFIIWALFILYKNWKYEKTHWKIFFTLVGLAIMTKSVIGFIPLFSFMGLFFLVKNFRKKVLKNKKEILYGLLWLFLIVAPWHIFMSLKYGMEFWREYIGYHVIARVKANIVISPYNNYGEVIKNRLGIWPIIFIGLLMITKKKTVAIYKKEFIFLLTNLVFIVGLFSLAKTVIPHYLLPVIPLEAIILGGLIEGVFSGKAKELVILGFIVWLNFLPFFILQASDYGNSNILIPRALEHLFSLKPKMLIYLMIVGGGTFLFFGIFKWKKYQKFIKIITLSLLIGMNIFIPFYPDKSPEIKKMGHWATNFSGAKKIKYIFMTKSEYYRTNTLLFYLPLGIKAERTTFLDDKLLEENRKQAWCVILKKDKIPIEAFGKVRYSFKDGVLRDCGKEK